MGIYSNGIIYGVYWRISDDENDELKTFTRKYYVKLDASKIQEIKEEYDKLDSNERNNICIRFYTKCSTTYDPPDSSDSFMWWPGSTQQLEELFQHGDARI